MGLVEAINQNLKLFGTMYYGFSKPEDDFVSIYPSTVPVDGYIKMDGSPESWALFIALLALDLVSPDGASGDALSLVKSVAQDLGITVAATPTLEKAIVCNPVTVICDEYGVREFAPITTKRNSQPSTPKPAQPVPPPAPKQQQQRRQRKDSHLNNRESTTEESFKQSFHEDRDGGKHLGHMSRENGRYGSLPLYEDHGDESSAE